MGNARNIALLVVCLLLGPSAVHADEWNDCAAADPAIVIPSCSRIIDAASAPANKMAVAYYNRGLAHLDLGKTAPAIDDFTRAIGLGRDYALPYYARGNAYYQLDQYEKALRDYDEYVDLAPKDEKGYAARALVLQGLDRTKEAMADFELAIVLNPKYSLAYFGRGQIRTDETKYNLAIEDFDIALALDPKDAVALRYRGYAQEMRGDRAKAAIDYQRTLTLNPSKLTEQRAYEGLARIKSARPKANTRAMSDCDSNDVGRIFRGCSNIAEDDAAPADTRARALIIRGLLYSRLDEYQRAITDFSDAIAAGGVNLASAYADRGAAYASTNQLDLAIKDFDQAIRLSPQDAGNRVNRAFALERAGRRTEALDDFKRALELSPPQELSAKASDGVKRLGAAAPSNSSPNFNEAEICSGTDPELVISGCTLVIANPAYPAKNRAGAHLNRGTAWSKKGDLAKAIDDYTHAIELDPRFAVAYENRGAMYFAQKDDERALADFQKAIELDSKDAFAYAGRGRIFERRGDRDAANADYERALSLKPGPSTSSIATEGRQRLIDTATRAGDTEAADCDSSDVDRVMRGCTKIIETKTHSAQMRSAALLKRGLIYMRSNDLIHASADFDAIIALNPADAQAYGLRGYIRFAQGAHDRAIADLTRSVELGTYRDGHRYLAIVLEAKGDLEPALKELEAALSESPRDAELLFHRGAVRERLGETAAAKQDYEAALASAPPETVRAPAQAALDRLKQSPTTSSTTSGGR